MKEAWIDSLKVGDTICDCREKHIKIIEFNDTRYIHKPWLVKQIIYWSFLPDEFIDKYMPDWWMTKLEDSWVTLCNKLNIYVRYDRDQVKLEDGSNASLWHCCSPIEECTHC